MAWLFVLGSLGLAAGFALWGKRTFAGADDSLVAERWLAFLQRTYIATGVIVLALAYVCFESPTLAALALPVVVMLAVYPARKRVFEETWPPWRYLAFQLRLFVAFAGVISAIALLPELVRLAPMPDLLAAGLYALLTVAMMFGISLAYPRVVGATPLRDDALEQAFAPVLKRARCARPALYVVDPAGGRFANAMAVPHPVRPRVLFGGVLLRQLSAEDLTAILGHELAHLEHHDRAYLRRVSLALFTLLGVAAVLTPLLNRFAPHATEEVAASWVFAVIVGWLGWLSAQQAHEGDCDARAVELVGDAEGLISGLTKLHTLARSPKRLTAEHEASSTHPTLQRRIERLRALSGRSEPHAPFETLIVRAPGASADRLVLTETHVRVLHGVTATDGAAEELIASAARMDAIALRDAASLALEVSGTKRRLVAVEASGRKLSFVVAPEDVPKIQAALDALDARGAITSARKSQRREWVTTLLGIALTGLLAALDPPLAFGALGMIALFSRGHRPSIHAVVGACAGFCALALLQLGAVAPYPPITVSVMAAIGALAAWAAWRARVEGPLPNASVALLIALGLFAVPSAIVLLLFATSPTELHFVVQKNPSLVIFCAAYAGALYGRALPRRAMATAAAAFAGLAALAGSSPYRLLVLDDPALAPAPAVTAERYEGEVLLTRRAPGAVGDFHVSPGGRWALVRRTALDSDHAYDEAPLGGLELIELTAAVAPAHALGMAPEGQGVFLDDDRALLLEARVNDLTLTPLRTSDRQREAALVIDHEHAAFEAPQLSVDAAAGRYWVHLHGEEGTTRLSGALGAAPDLRSPQSGFVQPAGPLKPSAIEIMIRGSELLATKPLAHPSLWLVRQAFSDPLVMTELKINAAGPHEEQYLFTTRASFAGCAPSDPTGKTHWCVFNPPGGARVFSLDTRTGELTPRAAFPHPVHEVDLFGDTLSLGSSSRVYLWDTRTARAHAVDLRPEQGCFARTQLLPNALAIVRTCGETSTFEIRTRP